MKNRKIFILIFVAFNLLLVTPELSSKMEKDKCAETLNCKFKVCPEIMSTACNTDGNGGMCTTILLCPG